MKNYQFVGFNKDAIKEKSLEILKKPKYAYQDFLDGKISLTNVTTNILAGKS